MADINTQPLAGKIAALGAVNLERLNELLKKQHWRAALDLISDIDADAKTVSRSCAALANKVNQRHWSPLLGEGDGDG
jgi:predicted thioredoxin/glutaredoxin